MRNASAASMRSRRSTSSLARAVPSRRTSRCVPPELGMIPIATSGSLNARPTRRRRGSPLRARARAHRRRTSRGSPRSSAAAAMRTARTRPGVRGSRRGSTPALPRGTRSRPHPPRTLDPPRRSRRRGSSAAPPRRALSPSASSTAYESALSLSGRRSVSTQTSPRPLDPDQSHRPSPVSWRAPVDPAQRASRIAI